MIVEALDREIQCLVDRIRLAANSNGHSLVDRYFVTLQLRIALDYCRVCKNMLQLPAAQLPRFEPMTASPQVALNTDLPTAPLIILRGQSHGLTFIVLSLIPVISR